MTTIRIKGDAIAEHKAMHDLRLHHDAPAMVEVDGMLLPAEVGNYTVFTTRENPKRLAAKVREKVPGAQIEAGGWLGWYSL